MSPGDPCLAAMRVLGHELRRPLTVIRGAATLLVDDGDALPESSRREMLTLIDRGATGMAELVDDVLTAVHLEQGVVDYRPRPLDVGGLLEEPLAAARRADAQREIRVEGADGLVVEADAEQAVRVLRALLVNAVRHSPAETPVDVVAAAAGDAVTIEVRDRGRGIPADQVERAFARFERLDGSAAGAGLGLFLARGLARGMGGDVAVHDREDGGTVVCFTLRRRG